VPQSNPGTTWREQDNEPGWGGRKEKSTTTGCGGEHGITQGGGPGRLGEQNTFFRRGAGWQRKKRKGLEKTKKYYSGQEREDRISCTPCVEKTYKGKEETGIRGPKAIKPNWKNRRSKQRKTSIKRNIQTN